MLITGAGGMVRVKATDYFCEEYAVTALTRTTLFITDHEALKQIFQTVKPAIVLNCVVVRNGRCSQNEQFARQVNTESVRKLALQCRKCDVVLVQLSTDYVVEGKTGGNCAEEAIPSPVSQYGCTKRAGDLFALEENKKTFVIRTAWLYGRYGNSFVHKILRQARLGQEIDILGNQYGNPISVAELLNMIGRFLQT